MSRRALSGKWVNFSPRSFPPLRSEQWLHKLTHNNRKLPAVLEPLLEETGSVCLDFVTRHAKSHNKCPPGGGRGSGHAMQSRRTAPGGRLHSHHARVVSKSLGFCWQQKFKSKDVEGERKYGFLATSRDVTTKQQQKWGTWQ